MGRLLVESLNLRPRTDAELHAAVERFRVKWERKKGHSLR